MDSSTSQKPYPKGTGPFKKGTGPLGVCPYLGMQDDPATHFAWAKPGHFCYRVRPAQAIEPDHQQNYCLNGKYPTCIVYPASWRGPLPSKVRDDAYMDWIRRAAIVRSSITGDAGSHIDEKTTSRFGIDLSSLREQAEFLEDESVPSPWWRRGGGRNLIFAVMAVVLIALVLWAAVLSVQSLFNITQASYSEALAGQNITATWAALGLNNPTPTPNVMVVASLPSAISVPSATPLPTSTWTPVPDTSTPTQPPAATSPVELAAMITSTQTATPDPYTCLEIPAYTYEIVRGPILVPEMGYVYSASTAPSLASAGWILRNTSPCTWENVLLLSVSSNRLLVPYIRQNGQLITENSTTQAVSVPPGSEIEVGLAFPLYMAHSIHSEWALVINNIRLVDQPHLLLEVNDWVLGLSASPTRSAINKPPGSRNRGGGDTPPSVRP